MLQGTGSTLTLVGGDVDVLAGWARAARASGFLRVAVSPGPAGLTAEALARLMAAGVGLLRATLHAAEAGAHDYHAGLAGSFRATTAMLRAARVTRLPATVTTTLTRSNARVLAALPGLLVDVGALAWRVAVAGATPRVGDEAERSRGALVPRLGVALPYALQAMAAAERAGVTTAIEGAPLCLLGSLADRSLMGSPRSFAPGCDGCEARARCAGIEAGYLREFGESELRPSAARAEAERTKRLQDMFSGPWLEVAEGACWPI